MDYSEHLQKQYRRVKEKIYRTADSVIDWDGPIGHDKLFWTPFILYQQMGHIRAISRSAGIEVFGGERRIV